MAARHLVQLRRLSLGVAWRTTGGWRNRGGLITCRTAETLEHEKLATRIHTKFGMGIVLTAEGRAIVTNARTAKRKPHGIAA
jgi:hypothetical protein